MLLNISLLSRTYIFSSRVVFADVYSIVHNIPNQCNSKCQSTNCYLSTDKISVYQSLNLGFVFEVKFYWERKTVYWLTFRCKRLIFSWTGSTLLVDHTLRNAALDHGILGYCSLSITVKLQSDELRRWNS